MQRLSGGYLAPEYKRLRNVALGPRLKHANDGVTEGLKRRLQYSNMVCAECG
jgi:hypothetical protein